ncbi:MAG: fatty acid desaturase [Gammaproteobacteria bacterium]|nr:MAG: fatty acid desaturase [Gammaproteobacteria bacterium]
MASNYKTENAPINWPVTMVLGLTFLAAITVVPWYGFTHGFSGWAWLFFAIFLVAGGIGIGSGYHRLWSHRAYSAHWTMRLYLAIVGGMTIQNSILVWCIRHRIHHRDVDNNDKDPYSIGRGFWFAHIGWMLKDYESGKLDWSIVPDLERDPVVAWQHKYYWPLVLITNIALPWLLGWMVGDIWGVLLLAGILRLVISHHVTFFINSLAHMWGSRPYTDENTARDNWLLAIVTYGEGYHNFHHLFQSDYRNGIRWWQYDINKWFIAVCAKLGLANNLKRTPDFKIQRARLNMIFKRAQAKINGSGENPRWRELLETEYAQFRKTIAEWQQLQMERVQQSRQKLADAIDQSALAARYRELEKELKMQRKRIVLLTAQFYG